MHLAKKIKEKKRPLWSNHILTATRRTSGDDIKTPKRLSKTTSPENYSAQTLLSSGLTNMGRSWVFTLEKIQSPHDASNKKTTRKSSFPGRSNGDQTKDFLLRDRSRQE
jgi:hypothetical protein